eukprot:TRINITY_DN18207_c0_g1_i1.p1 TRINITY_DN18207_c0_g1~~TRINITY_DN18207_c0_g1_i1.p1  ORF type:complete len:299 (-),score=39.90 TRINITY_DN18207_c0_g1_i1:77-973(-)
MLFSRACGGCFVRGRGFPDPFARRAALFVRTQRPVTPLALAPAGQQAALPFVRLALRTLSDSRFGWREKHRRATSNQQVWWVAAGLMGIFGGVWALVPLYKIYCQSTGQGQAVVGHKEYSAPPEPGSAAAKRLITVDFSATVHTALPWEFVPQQRQVVVGLGETCLAFYRAKNTTDRPIIGVSVYHMLPPEAGLYFNKIQCFCFDEQLINPNEEVDLPIFFFVDPLLGSDSRFDHVKHITLSYLFFESDSELPEEYEAFIKGSRSSQTPLSLNAPGPPAGVTIVSDGEPSDAQAPAAA